jgi:Transglycosylase SLT domain
MGDRSSDQTVPVEQPGQPAANPPGSDPSPAIAAGEQGLLDFLNRPIQQILNQLPLQRFPQQPPAGQQPAADPQQHADPAGMPSPFDPMQIISPVLGALGTLGSGLFPGLDPTQIFSGVADAIDGTAMPLQQARSSLAHDFQGGAGAAADAKTRAAVADGAAVATQADGLRENLSTAASDVAHARRQMIEIIDEFQAQLAAIGPAISTPSGRAAAIAAANKAHKEATAVMKELQSKLGTQAEKVSAIGAPVDVNKPKPKPAVEKKPKRHPDVDRIPVSSVQYKPDGFDDGRAAYKRYLAETLDVMGITDPQARRNWTTGLMTAASRESSFNPGAVNKWDSNAHGPRKSDGAPANSSRGGLQTIPTTFAAYHQAGTSNNIYHPVANAAAAMNYVMDRYDVDRDGSNLDEVSQFDPNDDPRGY